MKWSTKLRDNAAADVWTNLDYILLVKKCTGIKSYLVLMIDLHQFCLISAWFPGHWNQEKPPVAPASPVAPSVLAPPAPAAAPVEPPEKSCHCGSKTRRNVRYLAHLSPTGPTQIFFGFWHRDGGFRVGILYHESLCLFAFAEIGGNLEGTSTGNHPPETIPRKLMLTNHGFP